MPDNLKKWSRLYWAAIVTGIFLLALYLIAFVFSDFFEYKGLEERNYGPTSYDSRSADVEKSSIKEFKEEGGAATLRQMAMSFRMRIHSIDDYNNVFQTAPINNGIRMELSEDRIAALILNAKTSDGSAAKGVVLTKALQLDRWYSVWIVLDRKNHLKVWLDDRLVVNMSNSAWDCEVSDIALGTGMSKTRPFDGEIANFSIHLELQQRKPQALLVLSALRAVLAVFLFMFIALLCFYFAKMYVPALAAAAKFRLNSVYPRIATLKNLMLFHFFVCSLSLVSFTTRAVALVYTVYPENSMPVYNRWVLPLVHGGKPQELVTYSTVITVLFFFYSALYLLLLRPPRILAERFFFVVSKTGKRFFGYLLALSTLNVLVTYLDWALATSYTPAMQVAIWLCVFLLPAYLHAGSSRYARPRETDRVIRRAPTT